MTIFSQQFIVLYIIFEILAKPRSEVLVNQVDVSNLEEDKVSKDSRQQEHGLKPRHHGGRGGMTRTPWGDRYNKNNLKVIEKHIQSNTLLIKLIHHDLY